MITDSTKKNLEKKKMCFDMEVWKKPLTVAFHILFSINIIRQTAPLLLNTTVLKTLIFGMQVLFIFIMATIVILNKSKIEAVERVKLLAQSKWILIGVAAYILIDFVNCCYAAEKIYAFTKYLFICRTSITAVMVLLYAAFLGKKSPARDVIINIGITSVIVSLMSYVLYYTSSRYTVLDEKIAMSGSYNDFAVTILMGLTAIVIVLATSKIEFVKKAVLIGIAFIVEIPAIYLSSSKRGLLLLIVFFLSFIAFIIIKWIIAIIKGKNKTRVFKQFFACIIVGIVAFVCIAAHVEFFNGFNTESTKVISAGASTTERLEDEKLIEDSGRKVLFKIAIRAISRFSISEMLIGRGGSYSSDVYDNLSEEETKLMFSIWEPSFKMSNRFDPHNIFLNDFLEGGLIKIISLLFVVIAVLCYLIKLFKRQKIIAIILLIYFMTAFASLLVTAHYGALCYVWTLVIISILIAALSYSDFGEEEINDKSYNYKRIFKKINK